MKLKSQKTMIKHITNWYLKSTQFHQTKGKIWYSEANKFCRMLSPSRYETLAQIVSILSPQVDWETNKQNAVLVWDCLQNNEDVLGLKLFATELQKIHCQEIYDRQYAIPLTAIKTYNFAVNIMDPENHEYVTIDRHAVKVALNDLKAGGVSLTKKQYESVAECYTYVANKVGLNTCQLQAICWITYKENVSR